MTSGASVNVLDYGAVGDGVTDDTAAIQAALDAYDDVVIPAGDFACESMLELNSYKSLELRGGAKLFRPTASTSTDPVVWVKGRDSALKGAGQAVSQISTEKKSPNGVVLVGHWDMTVSHDNVVHNTISDFKIEGMVDYGQIAGAPDVDLLIQNPQIGGIAAYFQNITNIMLSQSNYGIWLKGWANGNLISNIQGYTLGSSAVNEGALIYDNGGLDNNIQGLFFHLSPDSTTIKIAKYDNTATTGGSAHSMYNTSYSGIVSEQGGSNPIGIYQSSSETTTNASYFRIHANLANVYDVDDAFWTRNAKGNSRGDVQNTFSLTNIPGTVISKSVGGNLSSLLENTTYKLFDVTTSVVNRGAVVEISFASDMIAGVDFQGSGHVKLGIRKTAAGVVTVEVLQSSKVGGIGLLSYLITGDVVSICNNVPNNGTATSYYKVFFSAKLTGDSASQAISTVYDTNTIATGTTAITAPQYL
jgi:hypothetical protein